MVLSKIVVHCVHVQCSYVHSSVVHCTGLHWVQWGIGFDYIAVCRVQCAVHWVQWGIGA